MEPISMTTVALMQLVPQLFKMGDGIIQKRKGQNMLDNNPRPVYQTPAEIDQALSISKREASRIGVAGQDLIEQNMGASLGSAAQEVRDVSSSSAEALAAITSLYGNQQVQQRNLGIQGSQDRDNRLALLKENLNLKAQYVDQEFQINEMQPFIDNALAGGALVQSGLTNFYSGLEGAGRVGSQAVLAQAMLGNGGETDPNTKAGVSLPDIAAEYLKSKPYSTVPSALPTPNAQGETPLTEEQKVLELLKRINIGGNPPVQTATPTGTPPPSLDQFMNLFNPL